MNNAIKTESKKSILRVALIVICLFHGSSFCVKPGKKEHDTSTHVASVWKSLAQGTTLDKSGRMNAYANDCKKFEKLNKNVKQHNPKETLRCMSYNVHFWRGQHKETIIRPVLEVIKKINPDIICLQEVVWKKENKKYLTDQFKKLGYAYGGERTFVAGKGPLGNIIFSKYPLSDLYSKKYKNPVKKEYRSFTGGTVIFNKEPIRFYCTHLDVWDKTEHHRLEEIIELTDHIKDNDALCRNVIFMGDFNAVRKEDYDYSVNNKKVWDLLVANDKKRGITTQTKALDYLKKLGYKDTFTLVGKKPLLTVWSGKIVDYIFVKPGSNLECKDSTVYYSCVSDHLPVIADFKVTSKKECGSNTLHSRQRQKPACDHFRT